MNTGGNTGGNSSGNTGANSGSDSIPNCSQGPTIATLPGEQLPPAQKGTQQGSIKGFKVLCLLEEEWSGLCISFVGGSQAPLSLEVAHFVPDSPRQPAYCPHTPLIYAGLSIVGWPDTRNTPCQFIPFDPFLAGACYLECARDSLEKVTFVSMPGDVCLGEFGREAEAGYSCSPREA